METATTKIPSEYYTLFWDTKPSDVLVERDKWFVVEKFINHGNLQAIKWLCSVLALDDIIEVIKNNYNISTKAAKLWAQVFNFDPTTCACMKRPSALRVFD